MHRHSRGIKTQRTSIADEDLLDFLLSWDNTPFIFSFYYTK